MFTGDVADDASPAAEAYVHDAAGTFTKQQRKADNHDDDDGDDGDDDDVYDDDGDDDDHGDDIFQLRRCVRQLFPRS